MNPAKRPEVRDKISLKALNRYKNKKYKKKHKKACKNYYKTHENHTKGKPKSEKQRKKMSKARKLWYINNPKKAKRKNNKTTLTNIRRGTHKKERNPNWHNGISKEPKKKIAIKLKNEIMRRDNYICQFCFKHKNELSVQLLVHHIDFNKRNDRRKNLITLCNRCHSKLSYNREIWIRYFQNLMLERGII